MTPNQRFVLDENRAVIDTLNPSGRKGYCHEGDPVDEIHLRERVIDVRLAKLVDDLIINLEPERVGWRGEKYQPFNHERHEIWCAVCAAIRASHLNALNPTLSIQNMFDGTPRRRKNGLQEFTSLSLFRDDVEGLLRDIYGDIKSEALDDILRAVFIIVEAFTRHVRNDLWVEHQWAMAWDYIWGIGLPEGYGLSGSDHRSAHEALDNLIVRVREVRENPSAFSKYTVEFSTLHIGEFIKLDRDKSRSDDVDEIPF